jgi:hypothetical protein
MQLFVFQKEKNGDISVEVLQNDVYEHFEAYYVSQMLSFACTGTV